MKTYPLVPKVLSISPVGFSLNSDSPWSMACPLLPSTRYPAAKTLSSDSTRKLKTSPKLVVGLPAADQVIEREAFSNSDAFGGADV